MSTKLRKPSQRSIDLYNQLVERQNKVRKQLRRIHKQAEETFGSGRLPALIIPKRSHKLRKSHFQGLSSAELHRRLKAYWSKLAELKSNFSAGLKSYLAKTVKEGYLQLWLDQIEAHSGETPDAFKGHLFSKEQMEKSEYGDFMRTYNRLYMLSPESFLAMLYTGRMLSFKYIYREMEKIRTGGFQGSWLEEQNELLNLKDEKLGMDLKEFTKSLGSPKKQVKTMEDVPEDEEERLNKAYKSGKHGHSYKGSDKPKLKN